MNKVMHAGVISLIVILLYVKSPAIALGYLTFVILSN